MIFEWLLKVIVISGIAFAGFFALLLVLQGDFAETGTNIVAAILTFFATMFTAVLGANAMYVQIQKNVSAPNSGNPHNSNVGKNGEPDGSDNRPV